MCTLDFEVEFLLPVVNDTEPFYGTRENIDAIAESGERGGFKRNGAPVRQRPSPAAFRLLHEVGTFHSIIRNYIGGGRTAAPATVRRLVTGHNRPAATEKIAAKRVTLCARA